MEMKTFCYSLTLVAALFASTTVKAQSPNVLWIGHTNLDRINTVIFNNSGDTLISGSSDRLINFWRVSDGKLLRTLNTNAAFVHESAIEWLSITKDGTRLASATHKLVKLWTLPAGTEKHLLGHTDWVVGVAFSPNGQLLASASFDGTVRIWRASDGAFVHSISNPRQMRTVAFSPDGSLLAGAGGDTDVHLWKTSDWSEVRVLDGHASDIYVIAFSPDGTRLASGGYDRTVKVWNVSTGANLYTLGGNNGNVYGIAFTPDGTQLAYTDGEGSTVRIHRVSDGARLRFYNQQVDQVQTLAYSPSGLLGYGIVDERVYLARVDSTNTPPPTGWSLLQNVVGSGTIQASPSPNGPNGTYVNGTVVTLKAIPQGTNRFISWSGAVSGSATNTTVTMNANKSVTATFTVNASEEIVWQNVDQKLAAWLMDGTSFGGAFLYNNGSPVGSGWRMVGVGDFTSDNQKDFLFQHMDGRLAAWQMNGPQRVSSFPLRDGQPVATGWKAVGTGDFTLDGKTDILFQRSDGCTAVWKMNGAAFVTSLSLRNGASAGAGWQAVGSGDFNGDNKVDILWYNTDSRKIVVWLMNGTNFLTAITLRDGTPAGAGWRAVGTGDFNNDNKLDVLWHHDSGQVAVWFFRNLDFAGAASLRNGQASTPTWDVVGIK